MQKKTGSHQFNIESIKDPDLRAYLEHLNTSLNKQNQELKISSLENKIFERYFQTDDTQQLIKEVGDELRLPGSSMRILVNEDRSFGKKEWFVAECGEFPQEYAYLDSQIVQQVADKPQLIITDTTKIHSIKFSPEKRFPKTIAAFHFLHSPHSDGYLWLTYEVVKEITDFELETLSRICGTLAEVCTHSQKYNDHYDQALIFERALQMADFPVLVLNDQKEICFVNSYMESWSKDQLEEVILNPGINDWLSSGKEDSDCDILVQDRNYHLIGKRIKEDRINDIAILFLLDETEFARKQTYLKLAIDTVDHDFKSALVNLQGFSKLLGMVGELNLKQSEYLGMIGSGVEDISAIVDDLFEVSRLEEEGGLRLSANQPSEILKRAVELVQAEARQKRIEVQVTADSEQEVLVDRKFLLIALHTLLTNAVRNSHLGGVVYLAENITDGDFVISVKDEGKGISQVDIEKLETTHFQDKDWPGLSLVYRIVKFHNGKLKIESELGKGSQFSMHLPCK